MEGKQVDERRAVRAVTGVTLASVLSYAFANTICSVVINEVIDAFSLTGAAQGLMTSMMYAGMTAALLLGPVLQGRIRKTTLLVLSGLLQAAALVLAGSAATFPLHLAALALLGVGCGWLDSDANSIIVDAHPVDGKKYLGALHGLYGIGSLLTPVVIGWLLLAVDWRGSFFAIATLLLMTMAVGAIVLKRIPRGAEAAAVTAEQRLRPADIGAYLKNGRNLLLLGCGTLAAVVQTGVVCWIVRYMTVAFDAAALGKNCITIFWVCATANRFLAPRIKTEGLALVIWGAVAAAAVLAAGVLCHSAVAMCVAMGLLGFLTGHFVPMIVAECAKGYEGSTTLTTSVLMLLMCAGRGVIPPLLAAVTDGVSADAAMLLLGAASLLCAVLGYFAERLGKGRAGRA